MSNKRILFYTLFILGGIIILFGVLFYPSWHVKNELKLLSAGNYIVDFESSPAEFTKDEMEYYMDIHLELNNDGTFLFSKSVPIGRGSMGEWKIIGSEIERAIQLNYKSGLKEQVSTCSQLNCLINIQIPIYDENLLIGHKSLTFKKISNE